MILTVTGHRPAKLGGYGPQVYSRLTRIARDAFVRLQPDAIITGMALGWDTACAQVAIECGIPFIAAIPFPGQDAQWPVRSRFVYEFLLRYAAGVEVVNPGPYAAWKMQKRNEWMVDHGDHLLSLWNGTEGGTANCVDYARSRGVAMTDVWNEWLALQYTTPAWPPAMVARIERLSQYIGQEVDITSTVEGKTVGGGGVLFSVFEEGGYVWVQSDEGIAWVVTDQDLKIEVTEDR